MIREIKQELVEYISRSTGLDREIVVKVLRAEEAYLMAEIQKALKKERW